jgi:hypothetical protein
MGIVVGHTLSTAYRECGIVCTSGSASGDVSSDFARISVFRPTAIAATPGGFESRWKLTIDSPS